MLEFGVPTRGWVIKERQTGMCPAGLFLHKNNNLLIVLLSTFFNRATGAFEK